MVELFIIQIAYVVAAFVAVGISSVINWKSYGEGESFDVAKFFSAYVRTTWALVPMALLFSASFGLTVEGILAIVGLAFGIDSSIVASKNLKSKTKTEAI